MSSINDLFTLMPRPRDPIEIPTDDDFRRCERELTVLPDDYKQFLRAYGSGVADDFLWVFNPVAENAHLNLVSQVAVILSALEESASKFPDAYSMPRFPAEDGLLPFASTDNGDSMFWVANSRDPNEWTIAIMGPRSPRVSRYERGFIDFLVGMIGREIHCDIFPRDFPSAPPITFVAASE